MALKNIHHQKRLDSEIGVALSEWEKKSGNQSFLRTNIENRKKRPVPEYYRQMLRIVDRKLGSGKMPLGFNERIGGVKKLAKLFYEYGFRKYHISHLHDKWDVNQKRSVMKGVNNSRFLFWYEKPAEACLLFERSDEDDACLFSLDLESGERKISSRLMNITGLPVTNQIEVSNKRDKRFLEVQWRIMSEMFYYLPSERQIAEREVEYLHNVV